MGSIGRERDQEDKRRDEDGIMINRVEILAGILEL